MTTPRTIPSRTRAVLAVLFVAAFTMGSAEMLVVGMLDLISADLAVSVPAAGALVTANALGLAIGGPLLTLATTRLDRRTVVLAAATAFVLLNLVPVLVAGYPLFVGARVAVGAAQGLFIAAAITTATAVVPPERSGRAMAVVISGFATASALGLPLGTLLGQALGWRASFLAVVLVGSAVTTAAVAVVPSVPTSGDTGATGQARHAFAPRVLALLALCLLVFAGIQSALTYLVPYLHVAAGVSGAGVGVFLLGYGVATSIGSAAGGRFADADAARTLVVGSLGVTGSLLLLYLGGTSAVVAGLAVLGMGLFGMGMAPSMQHRVVGLAGSGAALASSLPASAVNAGIASGSLAGGLAIDRAGVPAAIGAGVVIALLAAVVAAATARLHLPATTRDDAARASEPVAA